MLCLVTVWDTLRESFWFTPVLTALVIGLAVGLLANARSLTAETADTLWLYSGGAEGARRPLSAAWLP